MKNTTLNYFNSNSFHKNYILQVKRILIFLISFILFCCSEKQIYNKTKFEITYPEKFAENGYDGRLLLMISNNNNAEPRFQINDSHNTQIIFGIDVESWKSGETKIFDSNIYGYPIKSIENLKEGEYYVQAFLHKYETFNLSTGYKVKLPKDQGEGQKWNISPKNLYSTPKKVKISKSDLYIKNIYVDGGRMIKRLRTVLIISSTPSITS